MAGFWPVNSLAQIDETKFKLYTKETGLSDNRITGIVQDHKGFMWIATRKGLNRFDGTDFSKFLHTEKEGSLPDNDITSLRYFRNECIGVATVAGAQLIDANSLKATNLIVPTDTALYYWSNHIRDLSLASDGHYITSTKTGVYAFTGNGDLKTRYDRYTVADVGKAWMLFGQTSNTLSDGSVLLQVENGFLHYDPATQTLNSLSKSHQEMGTLATAFPLSNIFFYADKDDNFFYTNRSINALIIKNLTSGASFQLSLPFQVAEELGWRTKITGLTDSSYAITGFYKGMYIITHHSGKNQWSLSRKFFADRFCSTVFADKESRLWIGTDEGLLQQQTGQPTILSSVAGISGHRINSLHCNDEKIFAGCYQHRSLLVLNKHSLTVEKEISFRDRYPEVTGLFTLIPMDEDTVWVGTNAGLLWMHIPSGRFGKVIDSSPKQIVSKVDILAYFRDSRGDYWLFTNMNNTVICYQPSDGRFSVYNAGRDDRFFNINQVFGMAEDRHGNLWFAGDGLCRWNRRLQRCDTLIKYFQQVNSYKNAMCLSLIDAKDNLWFHIADNGIMKYNPFTRDYKRFTTSNGLADNSIRYIIDAGTRSAALTDEGISLLDSRDESIVNYFPHDGMDNPGRYRVLYFDEKRNTIYAAGDNIISAINLGISTVITSPPPLFIREMRITPADSTIHYPQEKVSLKYASNDISISFGAISYTESGNTLYAWRFKKTGGEDWIALGK